MHPRRALPVVVAAVLAFVALARPGATLAVDCTSFVVQEDAQAVFEANADDRFGLDSDGDGVACESLPTRGGKAVGGSEQDSAPEPEQSELETGTSASAAGSTSRSLSSGERTYILVANDQLGTVMDSFSRVSPLLKGLDLHDASFIRQIAEELAIWQVAYEEARETTPPLRLALIHGQHLDVLALWNDAADDIAEGIDSIDAARIEAGLDSLMVAADLMENLFGAFKGAIAGELPAPLGLGDCAEVREWVSATGDNLDGLEAIVHEATGSGMFDNPSRSTASSWRSYGRQLDHLADAQRAVAVPWPADRGGELAVEMFDSYAKSFRIMGSAAAQQDQAEADRGSALFDDGTASMRRMGDQIGVLTVACAG